MCNVIRFPTWICLTWIHIFGFGVMGQTLSGRGYTGTSELIFYTSETTFNDAKSYCRRHDSELVKISDANINNAIYDFYYKKHSGKFWLWIGATNRETEGTWKWVAGGDLVYSNWNTGEPSNSANQDCAWMRNDGKWDGGVCNLEMSFVCQKEVRPNPPAFTVQDNGNNSIRCDLSGIYPQPSVSWYFEGKKVAESSTKSIYQTKGRGYAILNTQYAAITEEGNYTCHATNTIGSTSYNASWTSTIRVPSQPNIISVKPNSCNSSLVIIWEPNKRAIGIEHRITVSNSVDNTQMITPDTDNPQTFVTTKLKSSMRYKIQITPCPNDCKREYSASEEARTGGELPGNVRNATLGKVGPNDCKITWKPPTVAPSDPITDYRIHIRASIASLAPAFSENYILEETRYIDSNSTYLFHGKPNRKYSFGVQAITCSGAGLVSNIEETCTTDKQAPFGVPTPIVSGAINEEGKAKLTILIPDQKNGPLSCIFIMVRPKGFATGYPPNSLKQLLTANGSYPGSEYIAVAVSAARLTGVSKDITLGDGSETSCNVHSVTSRKRRSANEDGILVGMNKKLDPKNEYNIYTVSTTPSGAKVYVKPSNIQTLQGKAIEEHPGTSTAVMVASIVGSLLLIAVIIGIVIFLKRRKQNADARNQQQNNEHVYEYPTIPIGLQNQHGYETVKQNHPHRKTGLPDDSAYETYDARQPHLGNERGIEAAISIGGEGEYEVSIRQYEEIK